MAGYWGLKAIGARMEVNERTIERWHRRHPAFLMYRRRRGKHRYWFTNDALIHAWELARSRHDAPGIRPPRIRRPNPQT